MTMSVCLYVAMSLCLYLSIDLSIFPLRIDLSFHCVSTHLSIHQFIYLSIYFTICHFFRLSIDLSFFLSIDLCIYVSIYLSAIYLSICLPNLSIHLSIDPSIHLSIYRSIYLSIHFTLQTPHLTLGTKRPTLHFTFSILNTTSENHTLQTLQSTPCTLHPPVATLRTPDANSTFHMPTSALYTLQHHTLAKS